MINKIIQNEFNQGFDIIYKTVKRQKSGRKAIGLVILLNKMKSLRWDAMKSCFEIFSKINNN